MCISLQTNKYSFLTPTERGTGTPSTSLRAVTHISFVSAVVF